MVGINLEFPAINTCARHILLSRLGLGMNSTKTESPKMIHFLNLDPHIEQIMKIIIICTVVCEIVKDKTTKLSSKYFSIQAEIIQPWLKKCVTESPNFENLLLIYHISLNHRFLPFKVPC